jgi:hypothetical protein
MFMPHIIYLSKLQVLCSCGARVAPDPSLPIETVLHECADCRILQGLPPGPDAVGLSPRRAAQTADTTS